MLGKNGVNTPVAHITILGGGVAGLSAGHYAKKKGLPFTIYESRDQVGGLCATFQHGGFLFDCGAHRFHDKDPGVTREIKSLLGDKLKKVCAPSHVYYNGRMLNFPFTPLNLAKCIGMPAMARVGMEVLLAKKENSGTDSSFESYAVNTYGKTLATLFLLNYSEKLWGINCNRLSAEIAGERLKGFTPQTLFAELITGNNNGSKHVDGMFYYPEGGIGAITDALAESCGRENIMTNSTITSVAHEGGEIRSVVVNGGRRADVDKIVSTLPCNMFIEMLDPAPPEDVARSAARIRFRDIILVAVFLDKEYVTNSATVYFPSPESPFTRVYEPGNRNAGMSPRGKTSLVAEIPCDKDSRFWKMDDEQLVNIVLDEMLRIGWVRREDALGSRVVRVPFAYPIIEKDTRIYLDGIQSYLKRFTNLRISGRNGMFRYSWIHNMIRFGKEMV